MGGKPFTTTELSLILRYYEFWFRHIAFYVDLGSKYD